MKKILITSIKVFAGFAVILGLVYPLSVTAVAQLAMKNKANGSLVYKNNVVVGSYLIGQKFDDPKYFHSRPSHNDYDAQNSGGSNLAPTSKKLAEIVKKRVENVQKENELITNVKIPADMVLSSGSGLDPHISIENANIQSKRVAKIRHLAQNDVKIAIDKSIDYNFIGIWGTDAVNVLKLNTELDRMSGK